MSKNVPKLPKSGGAKKAQDAIRKIRNQQPSDRLVEIISEYRNDIQDDNDKNTKKTPIAAKDMEI